jgi:uncharacterized membrane protein SpoIIM required for sporulation
MKVSELLESRRANWRELEQLCALMEGRSRRRVPAGTAARFSVLYRAACADLALADAYHLPPGTVQYLHQLVGRAHNQLYRSRTLNVQTWLHRLFVEVPQRLFHDNCLRLAFCIFWGVFLLSGMMAYRSPEFAEAVIKKPFMMKLEEDFARPVSNRSTDIRAPTGMGAGMAGFYIFNNASIGLRCFAFGLLLGVGGLFATVFNASFLGACFGYMGTLPQHENFFNFVTAHGPFELTAVVLSAAAGMRLGFSLVDTKGFTRSASLRRAADESVPTVCAAIIMFLLAALIEGFLSPSAAPYPVKAAVGVISAAMLMYYFVFLGYPQGD